MPWTFSEIVNILIILAILAVAIVLVTITVHAFVFLGKKLPRAAKIIYRIVRKVEIGL